MALALTLTPPTVTVGQTFQAAVTGAAPGEVITFTYDAVAPQSATADAMGNASVTFTGTTTGVVVAAGATSGAATATVTVNAPENCVVTVSATPANPAAGQPVTLTATVTCGGVAVPGATVVFATTSGSLGVGVTSAAGQASITTNLLPSGVNVVTATVIAATTTCTCVGISATATVTVTAAQSCVVTLSSTPANPAAGQPVTLTATVTCGGVPVPGATVLFSTTSGPVGVGVTNASGQASVTTSALPAGANVVTATVVAATTTCTCVGVSATATVNVTAAQSCVVTLSSTPANPTAGQPVTLTATVTCGGVPVPGATVLFSTTSGPVGIGLTNASGQASVTTSALPAGVNVVTATVLSAGTTCTCAGVSATATVAVGVATGLTAHPACYRISFPPVPWAFATATFSASGATPGATVTFHLDGPAGPVVCTAVANASGNASCTATLNIGQVLFAGYTATSGGVSSSSTLSVCLT
ncbi:Ig-like domain repeat protein [Streptomyces sp. NPDC048434]|uniref:Ig-like domain repeat protein n=1 Tax=Streptomyces sp. NPDC048434 TaxID=3365549 RepID=UPI003723F029